MSITIHDLARLAGLNPSTVSRALRNDPRVRTSTRERITSLAAEHGYIPNLNARNLADGKTRMIALLMGSLEFPVEREAAVRLNEVFSRAGYTLAIFSYAPDADLLYADRLEKLTQKICDAAILFTPDDRTLTPHVRALLDSIRCPLVYLDRWFEKYPLPTVTTDNASAMRGLCDLAENAGMDGAVLNYHTGDTVSRNRSKHLRRELMQRNIPFLLPEHPDDIPAFLTLHRIRKPAVFTNNANEFPSLVPYLPEGFLTAAFDNNLPDDRTRFGSIFLCIQDFRQIAETAAEQILNQLSGIPAENRIIYIPPVEFLTF